jgi:hypothetical protein
MMRRIINLEVINMNENKTNKKALDNLNTNIEEFVIPNEAACSAEFKKGCFIMEEESEKVFNK